MSGANDFTASFTIGRRFAPDVRPHKGRLIAVCALSVLVAVGDLIKPWPVKWILDGALIPAVEGKAFDDRVLWVGVGAVFGLAVVGAILQYYRELWMAGVGHLVTRGMRFRIFSRLARLSPKFHAKHKSGDLLVRLMGDVPMVTTMIVDSSIEIATRTLLVVATLATMLVLDPVLTAASIVTIPALYFVIRWLSSRIRSAVRKQRRKEGTLADYLHESIAAVETVQSLGGAEHVIGRFARENRRTARAGLRARRLTAKLSGTVESLMGATLAFVLAVGSLRVLDGIERGDPTALSPGELLVFLSYVRNLIKPIRSASKHAAKISKGTACGERILAILEDGRSVMSKPGAPAAPERPQTLEYRNVSFRYDEHGEGDAALEDFSARFERGRLAAIVGRSGAGKSTASLLAARMFDPDAGEVCLDGHALPDLELGSVRERVGLSMQKTVLFGDTLRENLLLGRPEATEEELWRSLAEADVEELVRSLPEGLETRLGTSGAGLSGGQQSRIGLARTLLRDAPVLIVDEPFAGLDREASARVASTLRRLAEDRIVIVIAHDLEDLDTFEQIVYLERGRAVAQGTHAELARAHPEYLRVVRTTSEVVS